MDLGRALGVVAAQAVGASRWRCWTARRAADHVHVLPHVDRVHGRVGQFGQDGLFRLQVCDGMWPAHTYAGFRLAYAGIGDSWGPERGAATKKPSRLESWTPRKGLVLFWWEGESIRLSNYLQVQLLLKCHFCCYPQSYPRPCEAAPLFSPQARLKLRPLLRQWHRLAASFEHVGNVLKGGRQILCRTKLSRFPFVRQGDSHAARQFHEVNLKLFSFVHVCIGAHRSPRSGTAR